MNQILQHSWEVLVLVVAVLLLTTELGFHAGLRATLRQSPEKSKDRLYQCSSLQNALLGLLGLLLGFTFAMSVQRFDARKQLVVDEANAIGTCWLEAAFLSDPTRDKVRAVLADYVDVRLAYANARVGSPELEALMARSEQNQLTLWQIAVSEAKARDTPSMSLFAASLNDVISMDGKRQASSRNYVPRAVWALLLLVSCTVTWTTGYTTGLGESGRYSLAMIITPVMIAFVITIVADLDEPHEGMIKVSQQSMIDLQQLIRKYQ